MKPLPSATITASAGSPCSDARSSRAKRAGGTNSGLQSSIVSIRATAGKKLTAMAGAWRAGTALKACTVMSIATNTSTGARAAMGITSIRFDRYPSIPPTPMNMPVRPGITGLRTHLFVGGMADVRCGLRDTAGDSRHQRGRRFGQQNAAYIIVIARDPRAFGVVDAAHHRQQRERQYQRQIVRHAREAVQDADVRMRKGQTQRRQCRGFDRHARPIRAHRRRNTRAYRRGRRTARPACGRESCPWR